jgi:cytochrome b
MMISDSRLKTILVWDLSTRFFHWLLVALVALAWITGEAEGSLFIVHKLAGYGVLAAILFRLIWGFVGGEHARFRDFIYPWSVVSGYAKSLLTLRPRPSIGHNPLGGWMIILLLVALIGVAGTGLFAFEEEVAGPLASSISPGMGHVLAEIHEALAYFLLFLIGIHIAGVFIDSVLTGHNLIRSMFTGRKAVSRVDDVQISAGYVAPYWYSAVALCVAMGITWLLVA